MGSAYFHEMHQHAGFTFGRALFLLLLLIVLGAAITAVVLMVSQRTTGASRSSDTATRATPDSATSAVRILEERFARGEIDDDEYRRRRDVLRAP